MQKLYRLSTTILIMVLLLLAAPPARAAHVIAIVGGTNFQIAGSFALTETGEIHHKLTTWTLVGTVPGAFALSGFDFELTGNRDIWVLSVQNGLMFRSLVTGSGIGAPVFLVPLCSASPIRAYTITLDAGPFVAVSVVHEDGMICVGGSPVNGPTEPTATGITDPTIPGTFALRQNVPNPFNPTTVIHYDVPESGGKVMLRIYDVSGRLVHTLVDGVEAPGKKRVTWDGRNSRGTRVATGAYFYRMTAEGFTETRKMILLK